jgi:cell fate (sporulation/competence/biofilm development) regulator YmcA (YheA/YmcA/DUF963 family)
MRYSKQYNRADLLSTLKKVRSKGSLEPRLNFSFKPFPLDDITLKPLSDNNVSPKVGSARELKGCKETPSRQRTQYKYILSLAYGYIMPNFNDSSNRLYIRDVKIKWHKNNPDKTDNDFQTYMGKELRLMANALVSKYQELDRAINDELNDDVFEDDFDYKGFTHTFVYASKEQITNRMSKYNELSKWFYILNNMYSEELATFKNKIGIKFLIEPIFRHPVFDIQMDVTMSDSKMGEMKKKIDNAILRSNLETYCRFIASGEDGFRPVKGEKFEEMFHTNSYHDGYELAISLNMYIFALRFNYLDAKYTKNPTLGQFMLFTGCKTDSTKALINRYESVINVRNEEINALQRNVLIKEEALTKVSTKDDIESLQTDIDEMNEQIDWHRLIRDRKQRGLDACDTLKMIVTSKYEDILNNINARNVAGAIYGLQATERNSYNEIVEEESKPQTIVLTIEDKSVFKP